VNEVKRRLMFRRNFAYFSAVVHGFVRGFGGKGGGSGKFDRGGESTYDGKVGLESAAPCRDPN
jgi:hypothetical protein